jgi:hypothetical protein
LMPRDVTVLLSNAVLPAEDLATALTLARSITATGRKVTFQHGLEQAPALVDANDPHRWTRGLVVVGPLDRVATRIDQPFALLASAGAAVPVASTLATARIGGVPVLLVADTSAARAGGLIGSSSLPALRDTQAASVGDVTAERAAQEQISFDELGVTAPKADVFGRAEMPVTIESRALPGGTKAARLLLNVMVAPDGNEEKAVVSAFVNEHLLASSVAAVGEPTRLDIALPDGLVGNVANIRTIVQRRSAQADCRFEAQGYPAEILGSSALVLAKASAAPRDFSDLLNSWADGVEVIVPDSVAAEPLSVAPMLANILSQLTANTAPISVTYTHEASAPSPSRPFLVVGNVPPEGSVQRVRFDRGRVAITDRAGQTRLDLGGLTTGAVAQIVNSQPKSGDIKLAGLWIKPLSADGALPPVETALNLDRGDVAFVDKTGVALALATERDTLLQISYPAQTSWISVLERFRSWIVGGAWALVTIGLLLALQRAYRRRRLETGE